MAAAGDTVRVMAGTYPESVTVNKSGTASAPITFTGASVASVTVQGIGANGNGFRVTNKSYILIQGFTVSGSTSNGIDVGGSDHITIRGNRVTSAGNPNPGPFANGINLHGSSTAPILPTTASTVVDNTVDHNTGSGIFLNATASGNVVSGNRAYSNFSGLPGRLAAGITVNGPGNVISSNISFDNEDSGIEFIGSADDALAVNNVVYNNGDHGIDNRDVTGGRVIANTVYRNCTSGINVEGTAGNYKIQNNIAVDNAVLPAVGDIACSRRAGNIAVFQDPGGTAPTSTTANHNLVYLSTSGTMYAWGTSTYSSLTSLRTATGQEQHGLQANPRFVNSGAFDLHLQGVSPALDSADSGASGQAASDARGAARADDSAVANTGAGPRLYDDRGAYEFQPPDRAPIARLTVTPASGAAPLAVTANASASTDVDATPIASYRFDFGDGTAQVGPQAGATATHTYGSPGTYTVTVTVADSAKLSSTATTKVTVVKPPPDVAPAARLVITPANGVAPLDVAADASASTDTDATPIATYRFDFGDGTAVVGPRAGASATHTYLSEGSYTVRVTVADSAGLSATASAVATVSAAPTPVGSAPPTPAGSAAESPAPGLGASPEGTDSTPSARSPGYRLVASDGGIFAFGNAPFFGSTGATRLNRPIVGMAATPSNNGYWLVASDGGIFAFGDAAFFGSTGAMALSRPIVGMASTPSGRGYWLVASDGGIFAFGDARFQGSTGATRLNKPIVGMAATPGGNGYWLVASDGGIFAFGDARFQGSTGAITLNKPIVGMAPTPGGTGYWLVASDGGIFAFGDARFLGSTGAISLNKPIVGMAATPTGNGYRLVASDGGIFAFGNAPFLGSTGAITLNRPIAGLA